MQDYSTVTVEVTLVELIRLYLLAVKTANPSHTPSLDEFEIANWHRTLLHLQLRKLTDQILAGRGTTLPVNVPRSWAIACNCRAFSCDRAADRSGKVGARRVLQHQ